MPVVIEHEVCCWSEHIVLNPVFYVLYVERHKLQCCAVLSYNCIYFLVFSLPDDGLM